MTLLAGVLILSSFAGAAEMMDEAMIVNPFFVDGMADGMFRGIHCNPRVRGTSRQGLLEKRFSYFKFLYFTNSMIFILFSSDNARV